MQSVISGPKCELTRYWDGTGTLVQYTFVKENGTYVDKCTPISHATNDRPLMIIQNTVASGYASQIPLSGVCFGPSLAKAGGTCTPGKMAKIDGTGCVVNATPTYGTEQIVGIFLSGGSSGDFVWLFVIPILAAGA